MKIEKLPKSRIKFEIEVSKEILDSSRKKALQRISNDIKVPGFRPGHIPENVIEEKVGKDAIFAEIVTEAMNEVYRNAVTENKLLPISHPKVDMISKDPLKFSYEVTIFPEVKLKDLDKIKIPKKEQKVTKKEVDEMIDRMRKMHSKFEVKDGKAEKQDLVHFSLRLMPKKEMSEEEKNQILSVKPKEETILLYDGYNLPEVDKNLEGMKKGEKKDFDVSFDEKHPSKELAGKTLVFSVEIKEVKKQIIPNLDEEFIEKAWQKKMKVDEFLSQVEKNMLERKEMDERGRREEELLKAFAKNIEADLPEELIKNEEQRLEKLFEQNLQRQGASKEKYLEANKLTEESLKKEREKAAQENVKIKLALEEVVKTKNPELKENEVNNEISKLLAAAPDNEKSKRKEYFESPQGRGEIKYSLKVKKIFDIFLAK